MQALKTSFTGTKKIGVISPYRKVGIPHLIWLVRYVGFFDDFVEKAPT